MISLVVRHLVESTILGFLVLALVKYLRDYSAALRYSLLLAAIAKFVLPSHSIVLLGERLRTFLPAGAGPVFVLDIFQVAALPAATPFSSTLVFGSTVASLWLSGMVYFVAVWLRKLPTTVPGTVPNCTGDLQLLSRLQTSLGMRRRVRLLTSESAIEPQLMGILRPTIILTANLSKRLSPMEFQGILLHELAHAKRWDNLVRSLVHIVACIFWFHPLLWMLEKRLDAESELACDELVLAMGVPPQTYLGSILKVCQLYLQKPMPGCSNVSGSNLKRRMEYIMSNRNNDLDPPLASAAGALVLIGVVIAALGFGFVTSSSALAQNEHLAAAMPTNACVWGNKPFPKGTIVRVDGHPKFQLCTSVETKPRWITVTEESRDKNQPVIELTSPPPLICKVTAPQGKLCTCEDKTFSPGSTVRSEEGTLVCPATGGKWQPFKGKQEP